MHKIHLKKVFGNQFCVGSLCDIQVNPYGPSVALGRFIDFPSNGTPESGRGWPCFEGFVIEGCDGIAVEIADADRVERVACEVRTTGGIGVRLEEDRLRIDTAVVQAEDRAVKFGVLGKSGEIRHKVHGQTWTSHVPFSDIGPYPDGGSNLTAFVSSQKPGDGAWAEIEQVGVARWLEPWESVWLEESVRREEPLVPPASEI